MKKMLAAMALVFCAVLAIWVAFRLAPETWAVLAGLIFGLIATLPMCAIVVLLITRDRNKSDRPAVYIPQGIPAQQPYPVQQPYVVMNADPAYAQQPTQQLPPQDYTRYGPAPRNFSDRGATPTTPPSYRWADEDQQPARGGMRILGD